MDGKWSLLPLKKRSRQPADSRPRKRGIGKLFADENGTTAIEFAIVAIPFLMIVLGLLEISIMFVIDVNLDSATANFATLIRTGQVQAPGASASSSSGAVMDLSDAKTKICNNIPVVPLSICTSQLQIDVRTLSAFSAASGPTPISGSSFNTSNLCYYSGNAGNVVQITAYFMYQILNPILLPGFAMVQSYNGSTSGNYFPITTVQVFKSENYTTGSNTGAGC